MNKGYFCPTCAIILNYKQFDGVQQHICPSHGVIFSGKSSMELTNKDICVNYFSFLKGQENLNELEWLIVTLFFRANSSMAYGFHIKGPNTVLGLDRFRVDSDIPKMHARNDIRFTGADNFGGPIDLLSNEGKEFKFKINGFDSSKSDGRTHKHNKGKTRFDLFMLGFQDQIEELGRLSTLGAVEYGDYSWQQDECWQDYFAAALRHFYKFNEGEIKDTDGVRHLVKMAWNVLVMDYIQNKKAAQGEGGQTL
jgi:hypothetical protein